MSGPCVITGTSRGIGRATALRVAARGRDLALIGRPSAAQDETRRLCEERGVRARAYACELAEPAAIDAAARALLAELGPPATVIHNAAVLERGPRVHEIAPEAWDRVLAVNLRAPYLLSRALLPAMLAAGRGRLVHVSSISGTLGAPHAASYGASKWGIIGLAKSLAEELRGTGLQSIAILPGSVDTDMLKQTPFPPDMSADEVAEVIVFHALDAPPEINGAAVEVYG
jgi:3-oxoacyl-[acyl-carrier protein] reductase